jgi:hypothetical protein
VNITGVSDIRRGEGPKVNYAFSKGDSFYVNGDDHALCKGRVYVIGPGLQTYEQGGMQVVALGVLSRCEECLKSFVV